MLSILRLRRNADSTAFEACVAEHKAALYRYAFRLCGNRDDAEDLIQEALVEAFQCFGRFQHGTHFDRWILRILRNTYIDSVRARPKVRIDSLDQPVSDSDRDWSSREIVDLQSAPDLELMAKTLDGPIQEALMALPEEFRTVVILVDINELTYDEVARTLQCPIGTVRSRLHRGRAILKDKLKRYARF